MKQMLFVCTGNTCRSPMAEAIFKQIVAEAGLDIEVKSAGVSAMKGMPISDYSAQILTRKGIQANLTSSPVTEQSMLESELILAMTMNHKRHLIEKYPQAMDKIFTLKEYVEDNKEVQQLINEHEQLISELQLKQALSQEITDQERTHWLELERSLPNYDVMDPIGGSMKDYEYCAKEIEESLYKLVKKLNETTK